MIDLEKTKLSAIQANPDVEAYDKNEIENLKKRKLVNVLSQKYYKVTKGTNYAPERLKLETDLNVDMIRSGAWKDAKFKKYNFNA